MGNTNFTMVMPTIQSFSAGGWSGGRAARKDYGTRSFGCKRDLCPFQVSGGGRVRLAFSSFVTAMARKLTTYVASRSSACLWDGWQVDARVDGRKWAIPTLLWLCPPSNPSARHWRTTDSGGGVGKISRPR